MPHALDWSELQLLLEVARAGSATAAARTLRSSPSRLTRAIGRLEQQLGTALFRRERDGLRPTEAGERVVDTARRMEAEVLRLSVVPDDAVEGVVRVATSEGLANLLIERGLCDLTRQFRGLRLEVAGGNQRVDLLAGEADLALRPTESTEAGVLVRKVASLEFGLYRSDRYRPGVRIDDPCGQDVVLLGGELAPRAEVEWLASFEGVRPVLRTSSFVALFSAVRNGVGLGVLPDAWAALEPSLERIGDVPIPARGLWLATAPSAAGRAAVRAVGARIEAVVRGAYGAREPLR